MLRHCSRNSLNKCSWWLLYKNCVKFASFLYIRNDSNIINNEGWCGFVETIYSDTVKVPKKFASTNCNSLIRVPNIFIKIGEILTKLWLRTCDIIINSIIMFRHIKVTNNVSMYNSLKPLIFSNFQSKGSELTTNTYLICIFWTARECMYDSFCLYWLNFSNVLLFLWIHFTWFVVATGF